MDSGNRLGEQGEDSWLEALMQEAAIAQRDKDILGRQAPAAMLRLARAIYPHDSKQSNTVAACLASVYNGGDALPVRLDEIRWLEWNLQRDLAIVMPGTGHAGFQDSHIREAFQEVGGAAGLEWFHWHTTGGPHRSALDRLAKVAVNEPTGFVREILHSLAGTRPNTDLTSLQYLSREQVRDVALIIDGPWGRDRGVLNAEAIPAAITTWKKRISSLSRRTAAKEPTSVFSRRLARETNGDRFPEFGLTIRCVQLSGSTSPGGNDAPPRISSAMTFGSPFPSSRKIRSLSSN